MIVADKEVSVSGRFVRTARLKAEYYELVDDPDVLVEGLKAGNVKADLFTFVQGVGDKNPRYGFYHEWESLAVMPVTTYEHWWKNQINVKTRNMIRKAQKMGVDVRIVPFDEALVKGIKEIYDESPLRQGKPFRHYGKDLATLRADHISFLDRSDFLGAFYDGELIGFIKLVHGKDISHCMQIIAKIGHRDKAPTNALIAKAVEICAERSVPYIHYGVWSKRGLGDFKKHHAFERLDLPRYFVPLTARGAVILAFRLHRHLSEHLPQGVIDVMIRARNKWNTFKYQNVKTP